ncbi:MAG: two-component system response regulator [Syntrophobacterales bacterium CG_4_8_14_3_um_filter_58_8]|nr:MAG: two-component system response regulator [Syntrophobacterales bacterium CG_4_8_14_3_um_filter_58_8]
MNSQNPVILCVDDDEASLNLLEDILVLGGYQAVNAASGKDALLKIKSQTVDLVLLDIRMPGMDGFEVCRQIKEDQKLSDIPIIMVTGLASQKDRVRGIEAGVEDYFSKPFDRTELLAKIKILLKVKKLNDERKRAETQKEAALAALKKSRDELDDQVRVRTAELAKANELLQADIREREHAEEQLQQTLESLRKAVSATVQVMVSAVETRDPYTAGHQLRSANLAQAIATEMGLPQDKIEGIRMAGSIHDIGKLSIPAEILSKPTKLSEIEFSLIKEHARQGYKILKNVESPWPLAEIVRQHHERMDGSGYPRNLKGTEILIEARILAVADVVEAMASHRPYRPGLGIDLALSEIEKNRGIFYDDAVADACLRLFREKGFQLEGPDFQW